MPRADATTSQSTPPDPKLEVIDYVSQAKRSRVHIEEKPYVNSVTLGPALVRKTPVARCPAAVHGAGSPRLGRDGRLPHGARCQAGTTRTTGPTGTSGVGPTPDDLRGQVRRLPRAAGGEDIRGKRWIVITGLVPIEKQETAYADTFKQSLGYDPQNDYPKYWCYAVERVEVASAADAAHPDWSKATKFVSTKEIERVAEWSASRDADIVAPEYIDNALVFPLPPLVESRSGTPASPMKIDIPVEKIGERDQGPGGEMRRRAPPRGLGDERMPGPLGA